MGLSTKGPITKWRGSWAHQMMVERNCRILGINPEDRDDQRINDAVALADVRETVRYGGSVRGLRFA